VPLVEGAGVAAVQVSHPVGEVRLRGLDEEVVVVPHQAAHVRAPAVAPFDPAQDVEEDDPISVVQHDRRVVVAADPDVVVGTGGEVTVGPSHRPKVAPRKRRVVAAALISAEITNREERARHDIEKSSAGELGRPK